MPLRCGTATPILRGICILNNMQEVWKDVLNYEGLYQVSDLGRIKAMEKYWVCGNGGTRFKKESILSPVLDSRRYYNILLSKNGKAKAYKIHRLVFEAFNGKTDLHIDHIVEGNKWDNRLCNLQAINHRGNISKYFLTTNKSSQYTGVSWHKQRSKWSAKIQINGRLKHLGLFINEIDAANAYQKALTSLQPSYNN